MNFNDLLILFVFTMCGLAVLQAYLRGDDTLKAWIPTHLGVAAVTAIWLWLMPADAGYVGMAAYLLLVGAPLYVYRQVRRLIMQQRYAEVLERLPKLLWMHPQRRQLQELRELWEALANAQQGRLTQAKWQLHQLAEREDLLGALAHSYRLTIEGDWAALREWFEDTSDLDLRAHSQLWVLYLRALGETGNLAAMLESYADFEQQVSPFDRFNRQYARVIVFAFSGRPDLIPLLFHGSLRHLPWHTEQFWQATAYQAAGAHLTARHLLGRLQLLADPFQVATLNQRLTTPLVRPSSLLQPRHWHLLQRGEHSLDQQLAETAQLSVKPGIYGVVHVLIGMNLTMFLLETLLGGSFNPVTLDQLGALVTDKVIAGEWWRTITATFLHQGVMHLGINMLMLYLLGIYVLSVVGKWRFLAVYLGSGIGGMAIIVLVNFLRNEQQMVVGASAGVMGLLAAAAVITWRHWRQGQQPETRLRFVLMVTVLTLQGLLDAFTPEVSSLAHASGAILGAILALLLGQPSLVTTVEPLSDGLDDNQELGTVEQAKNDEADA